MYFTLSKIFTYILIFFAFFLNSKAHSINQKKLYSKKSISNYFSGIISANNNDNKSAIKYFSNLDHLINIHDRFNHKLVFTLVQTQKIPELFLYLKVIKKNIKHLILNTGLSVDAVAEFVEISTFPCQMNSNTF